MFFEGAYTCTHRRCGVETTTNIKPFFKLLVSTACVSTNAFLGEMQMEINYQETSKDLLTRIDIHEKYGSANIDVWTNELLQPQAGMHILDVGCGAGKLSFLFDDYTKGQAKITGGDFSEELLDKARAKNKERGSSIEFH